MRLSSKRQSESSLLGTLLISTESDLHLVAAPGQTKKHSGGKAAFAGASHSEAVLKQAAAGARVRGRPAACFLFELLCEDVL